MRVVLVALLLAMPALAGCAKSETIIEGRVLDRDTQAPIRGAEVKLTSGEKPEHRALTDASGHYKLVVSAGAWNVKATAPGFVDADAKSLTVEEGKTLTHDLFLAKKV